MLVTLSATRTLIRSIRVSLLPGPVEGDAPDTGLRPAARLRLDGEGLCAVDSRSGIVSLHGIAPL
jgi:hypothetical protein